MPKVNRGYTCTRTHTHTHTHTYTHTYIHTYTHTCTHTHTHIHTRTHARTHTYTHTPIPTQGTHSYQLTGQQETRYIVAFMSAHARFKNIHLPASVSKNT